jgi:flagellar biosynthesis/type III secretory pathway chaperone
VKVSLDPVIAAVTAQKNAYSELLDLARAKRETIVSGDINQLDVILAAESDLLHQLGSLEQSRSQASQALAQQLGQRPEDLTWSSLPWQNSRQRQAMEKLQHEFAGILDALQQVNEVNSRLLTMHLDYVHELMNTVTKTVESSSYDAAGNPQPLRQQSVNLIDKVW